MKIKMERVSVHSLTLESVLLTVFAVHEEAVAAVPTLSCSKVHGVQAGETCFTVAQAEGLTQDVFLSFNPNINCQSVFVGQWVCLAATSA